MRYERIEKQGFTFLFPYHEGTDMLHTWVRHTTTPEDALEVFFDESLTEKYDAQFDRYEMRSRTHILTFAQLPSGAFLILSCMRIDNEPTSF